MTTVFLYPGQSSRYPGMLDKLVELHGPNRHVLERASARLDRDLAAHYAADHGDAFARNVDIQIGVFLANHMMGQILAAAGISADISLGLSLGEYNHLVDIGALDFDDALTLVKARGEAYDRGPRGWMASIQPLGLEELEEVVTQLRARDLGQLEIVNLNSPRQNVIAGDQAAIEAAVQVLEDEHYAQPVIIERRVPMHASMFAPVGAEFRVALEAAAWRPVRRPYIPNRLAQIVPEPTRELFIEQLAAHVHSPVLWRRSVDLVAERYPDAVFVEVGVKRVLTNLMRRKWIKRPRYACDSREDTRAHLREVIATLTSPESTAA